MKKLLLLLCLLTGFAVGTTLAQSCGEASASAKAKTVKVKPEFKEAAARAAALDANILTRKDRATGEVTYVRKSVCTTSGKVSYADVEYCNKTNAFVAAPATLVKNEVLTPKGGTAKKACCAQGTKVNDKGCCSAAQKAACSKADAKAKAASAKKASLKKSGV